MSRGFLVLAQNSVRTDFRLKPKHELREEFEGVFVDVWYRELSHIKGQHVYYDKAVYKVKETCLPNTDFNPEKYTLLVDNVRLLDDKNDQLEFHRASKDDTVLSNNKLYTVVKVDEKIPYTLEKLHSDLYIDIWYPGQAYSKDQYIWHDNTVYILLEDTGSVESFNGIKAQTVFENIKLFADNDTALYFTDPRKSATVLYFNQIHILNPVSIEDYVQQACLLAASIKKFAPSEKISIVTNDKIPPKHERLFHKIIPIPYGDQAIESDWKIENRWKMFYCSPYEETIVLDTDMLVLEDISRWWNYLSKYDLFFTSEVRTYRDDKITNDSYRKAFTYNYLPNIYTGLHYFKKSELASEFYELLETICKNWEVFYDKFLLNNKPPKLSIDVAAALAVKILDIENQVTSKDSSITFTHMKSLIQDWRVATEMWQKTIRPYVNKQCQLKIGSFLQNGIFHYTENDFINCNGISNFYE